MKLYWSLFTPPPLENTELLQTLEEFTQAKLRDEQVLYGKFTALLNTKKQRVACLEKMLFKNLCSDAEESKAVSKVVVDNYDSDTDPELEEDPDEGEEEIDSDDGEEASQT